MKHSNHKKTAKLTRQALAFLLAVVLMTSAFVPGLTARATEDPTDPTVVLTGETTPTTVPTEAPVVPAQETESVVTDPVVTTPTETTPVVTDPTETTAAPTEAVTVPTEETTVPTESITVPTEETTAPTESTTVPTEETTIPTEDGIIIEDADGVSSTIEEVTDEFAKVNGTLPSRAVLEVEKVSPDLVDALSGVVAMEKAQKSRSTFSFRKRASEPVEETVTLWTSIFDIKIKSGEEYWQPEEPVQVTIHDVYPAEFETIKIRHYLDTPDAVRAAMENGTALFCTIEGLSEVFPAESAALMAVDPEMTDTICYTVLTSADGGVIINEDGSISFETDSFSIISVQSDFTTPETDVTVKTVSTDTVNKKKTFELSRAILVNEEVYLMWDKEELLSISGLTNIDAATTLYGVWAIGEGTDIVQIESYREDTKDGTIEVPFAKDYKYFYVKVKALKAGNAKLEFTYREGAVTENRRVLLEVNVPVVGSEFWIEDKIAETGCLVPVTNRTDIVSYEWSKTAGNTAATIEPDALSDVYAVENGVNVAVDRGGISATNYTINTYTVKGKNAEGEVVASAEFKVMYGNEILNGGFENTNVNYGNTGSVSIHAQFPNGYPDLYWLTTGGGAIRYKADGTIENDYLGHDIEIFHDDFIGTDAEYVAAVEQGKIPAVGLCHSYDGYEEDANGYYAKRTVTFTYNGKTVTKTYNIPMRTSVPEGDQGAELNCEEYGALYQDVITTPGAELYWQVAHSARFDDAYGQSFVQDSTGTYVPEMKDGKEVYSTGVRNHSILQRDGTRRDHDYMCVIIMPTEHARKIITKADIDNLLANITYEGKQYFYDNAMGDGSGGMGGFYEKGTTLTATSKPDFRELHGAQAVIDGEMVTFDIIECKATNEVNDEQPLGWTMNNGTYKVPEDQYLTRFFFVATISVADNLAGGNFIDNVAFGERKPYKVEYYVQDDYGSATFSEVTSLREENMTLESTASASHVGNAAFSGYSLAYTTINDKTTSNKATTFSVAPPQDGSKPTLRLYYVKKGIAITKNVEITNNTVLLDTPVELLSDYSVTVSLYENEACTGTPVATAEIPFSSVTDGNTFTGEYINAQTVMFKTTDGKNFEPYANKTYYAKEAADNITNYTNDGLDKTITITTDANGVATAIVTNKYKKIETTNITIGKQVTGNLGDHSKAFTFIVSLKNAQVQPAIGTAFPDTFIGATVSTDRMTATFTLKHNESVTLMGLPVGVDIVVTEKNEDYAVEVKQGDIPMSATSATGSHGMMETTISTELLIGTNDGIVFTNDKQASIDTGISLDSVPYIVMLVGVAAVAGFLFLRKRRVED